MSINRSAKYSNLSRSISLEKEQLARIKQELKTLPPGRLLMTQKPHTFYYYWINDKERQSIRNDENLIYALARKRYLVARKKLFENDLGLVSSSKRFDTSVLEAKVSSILDDFEKAGLDISRITLTSEQYKWMHYDYRSNPYRLEELKYVSNSGTRVRSKSEKTIANRLEHYGIPYRYEPEVEIDVSSLEGIRGARMGQYKSYYPDFVIKRSNGDHIIWEHLGLINLDSYRETSFEKIFVYRQFGLVSDKNMILTFERDLVDDRTLDEIIVQRLLTD